MVDLFLYTPVGARAPSRGFGSPFRVILKCSETEKISVYALLDISIKEQQGANSVFAPCGISYQLSCNYLEVLANCFMKP